MSPTMDGKVALITGGAKNLGAQIAYELAGVGASLALHYNSDKTKKDADKLAQEFEQKYPSTKIKFYQGDLTTKANVDKLFDAVLKDFGGLNIVVNTVGMVLKKPITEISEEEYDTMFAWVPSSTYIYFVANQ
jgi:NAD(P)-dependent dehydrogenase (short-subunit alcohol dehydrogenase family)